MNQRSVVGQLNSKSKQIHGKQDLIVITKARGGEKELDVSSQKVLQKKKNNKKHTHTNKKPHKHIHIKPHKTHTQNGTTNFQ